MVVKRMFVHTKPRYSVQDLMVLLSIGRTRLYADINVGKLKTYLVGKRRYTDPADLDRYVEACKQ